MVLLGLLEKMLRVFTQKPLKDCAAISSASPVNTRTAEWIAAQIIQISYPSAKNKFFADGYLMLLRANGRSAVHVSMGEAG
jgi:hypothetical protein